MEKNLLCYFDMDGVLNLFEDDPNARRDMWNPGYFLEIPVRREIPKLLSSIRKDGSDIIILTKLIERPGVKEEKEEWVAKNIGEVGSKIIFVPYDSSKANFIDYSRLSILIDDGLSNLKSCVNGNCIGLHFLSGKDKAGEFPTAKNAEDIWNFYRERKMS